MRALLSFAVALSIAALQPAGAQEAPSAKSLSTKSPSAKATSSQGTSLPRDAGQGRTTAAEKKPEVSSTEKEASASRARNEARERGWDDKMKRTMRSICSGANGC